MKDLKHVLRPLKRPRMLKNYVDVGFDTEFTSEKDSSKRELLTLQFSLGKNKTRLYEIRKVKGVRSRELLNYTLNFLNEFNVDAPKHIFLIVHFGIAELSKVSDFYDEYFDVEKGFSVKPKISQFNGAIYWMRKFEKNTLHMCDLYGHMKTSLAKIGKSLNYTKIKIEVDGKPHKYWITHMKELMLKHPKLFARYAKRDAEVTVEAWKIIKKQYEPYNIDPHIYKTYTSIASAAFRRQLKDYPCKTRVERVVSKQRMKNGKIREHISKIVVFNGDMNARLLACSSYWGGNNQSFVRGYFPNIEATYYDFVSLYIIAGILQPLSNAETDYKRLTLKNVKDGYEGFCEVDFEFPENEDYPCLPVRERFHDKLMFTRRGYSYCTLSELREALAIGVKINSFRGYGFYPTENEVEHDLKPFLLEMLAKKSAFDSKGMRDSVERQIEKGKMVGIIGRFAYMKPSYTAQDITRFIHDAGIQDSKFRKYARKKAVRSFYERSQVGGTWHIEWASLILGKARSFAARVIREGEKCLLLSTDGGFWLGDPKFEKTKLHRELTKFHSGIRFEGKIDELWVARNRLYCTWLNGEVLHLARAGVTVNGKGSNEKDVNFEKMIRESLKQKREVYVKAKRTRLSKLRDFVFENVSLDSELTDKKARKIGWQHDFKRKLQRDINVFSENTDTSPYDNVIDAWRDEHGLTGETGRPKVLTVKEIREIKNADKKITHKQLAEKYGVSVSTIKRNR